MHCDSSYDLLANEVSENETSALIPSCPIYLVQSLAWRSSNIPNLNLVQIGLLVLLNIDIDGEMGVDISHLVLEAFCNADDEVVDECSDRSEGSDALARAVVEFDINDVFGGVREGDGEMSEVFGEFS